MTFGDSEEDTGQMNHNPFGRVLKCVVGILQFTLLSPDLLEFVDFGT